MPKVDAVTDHSLAGGHGIDTVLDTLFMKLETKREGDVITAELHLHNQLPHSYPTGAPFRNFYVKLTALDAAGNVVWKNFKKHPMKEDPKSMFVVVLGDCASVNTNFGVGVVDGYRILAATFIRC